MKYATAMVKCDHCPENGRKKANIVERDTRVKKRGWKIECFECKADRRSRANRNQRIKEKRILEWYYGLRKKPKLF